MLKQISSGVQGDKVRAIMPSVFQVKCKVLGVKRERNGKGLSVWNCWEQYQLDIAVSSRWHGPCRCLFFYLWPRNRRSDEEVTMETFACLPKDYMLTLLVWQFDVVWNLTFMMWHIWPFDPLNDLRSWWKKIHMYKGKMHCSKSSKKFLLSLVMEIKNYKAKTGNDPCDPIWPLINLRSTTAI